MFDFASKLTFGGIIRYVAWRAASRSITVKLRLRSGPRFELRPDNVGNNDYGVAYEVFVHEYYNDHSHSALNDVKMVVDLGANVGLSLLYFLHRYKDCQVIAVEPHPRHFAQAQRNLVLDGTRERVRLYSRAAGASSRAMRLSDQGSSSSLVRDRRGAGSIPVESIDIFPLLIGTRIDLLKIDIEGGEYEILGDDRFGKLDIGAIIMEWHKRGTNSDDKAWCEERLRSFGYSIEEIFSTPSHGMLRARP